MNTMREIMMLGAVLCTVALAVPMVAIWKGTSRAFPAWSDIPMRSSDMAGPASRAEAGRGGPVRPGPMPFATLAMRDAPAAGPIGTTGQASLLPAAGLAFLCACLDPYVAK